MQERFNATYLVRSLLLVIAAIALNIALGYWVQYSLQAPLFLDSIGTILVGALLGPLAGAATGAISILLWSAIFSNPTILPYALVAAFIGWAAGFAAAHHAFERFRTTLLAGFLTGFGAALLSAPITAYVLRGVTGGGADYLTQYLTTAGANILQATTIQGLLSDPLDKVISFALAWPLWRLLRPYYLPPTRRAALIFASLEGYSLAVVVNLLALLVCLVFLPAFERGIFSIFFLAVLLVAYRSGLGPALLTTAIGALAHILFLESPYYALGISAQDWLRVVIFVIVSIAIAITADRLKQSRQHLQVALQAERESQARIRAITDGVNEALVLFGPDQRVLDTNRRFAELFGIPPGQLTGQRLADLRTLFDQVFVDADDLYQLVMTGSTDTAQEYACVAGQRWPQARELQLYSTPVRDAEGFLGRLFVFRDVTHEREVDRMKTEFVSLVSHELRTPLTSIKGYTEMVLDGDAGEINEEVQEYLGIVYNNAERLVALVNDLLDLSRIESGRIQIKLETVDLNEITQTVVVSMQQKIKEKGQDLQVEIDPAATLVTGDKGKLVQVLTNYVSNAYKYTQAGGKLRIAITRQGAFARVAVSDNGHGIAPEDQAKLFTRFYRVDNSMTREVGGTGLGLSIVKQLVELQGGEISLQSALGEGSTFAFSVPLAQPAEAGAESSEPPPAEDLPAAAAISSLPAAVQPGLPAVNDQAPGAAVLIVEDDPDTARLIAHHLGKAGYAVRIAHSAEEALAGLEDDLPDLITLDIELPGMPGDELARRLQNDPLTADIPLLMLSVHDLAPGAEQFNAFALSKPIDQTELLQTVAQMLSANQPGAVLVIDDDADVRRLLQTALEKQGLQVQSAEDGPGGLKLAAENQPGLILLDLSMPGMDGFAVLRALKENQATAGIPVIAMTGSPNLQTTARARLLALGASDFIYKPFDMPALVAEIKLFISR